MRGAAEGPSTFEARGSNPRPPLKYYFANVQNLEQKRESGEDE